MVVRPGSSAIDLAPSGAVRSSLEEARYDMCIVGRRADRARWSRVGGGGAPFHAIEEVVVHGTPTGESNPAAPSSAGGKDRLRV